MCLYFVLFGMMLYVQSVDKIVWSYHQKHALNSYVLDALCIVMIPVDDYVTLQLCYRRHIVK